MTCISCLFKKCPTKADRYFYTEEEWAVKQWTEAEKFRNAALPHKLWNMKHDDLIWPFCHTYRGDDAYGPLAGEGHAKYLPELPRLVKGRGISRWISAGDASILEIPQLASDNKVWTPSNLPTTLEVIERQEGAPNFGEKVTLQTTDLLKSYAPSPLQKFSDNSALITAPFHFSLHHMIKRREIIGQETKADVVFFTRWGWRWDSYDRYFVKRSKYIGLRWN